MKIGICTLALGLLLATPAWAEEVTRTFTGANGKTTTSTSTINRNPENKSGDRSTITTYPNGKTTSTNSTYKYNNNGNSTYNGTVTRTNRKGETNNYSVDGQRTRTDSTVTKSGTVTGANGNQGTYNNNRTCNSGECTFNRNSTYPNGKTREVNGTATRTGKGSYSGNATVTGRNGNVRSGSFTRTRIKQLWQSCLNIGLKLDAPLQCNNRSLYPIASIPIAWRSKKLLCPQLFEYLFQLLRGKYKRTSMF